MQLSPGRLALTLLASGALLVATTQPATAIVGGAPDGDEHPYVGQLLFFVPDAVDSRFDEPGGWFNCTGTLIDEDTVVTAGHCTYATGTDGKSPADLYGGNDVWFSVEEEPDYSILPLSSTFAPDRNGDRYDGLVDGARRQQDVAPDEVDVHPPRVRRRGVPPPRRRGAGAQRADRRRLRRASTARCRRSTTSTPYYSKGAKQRGLFESVGYGLEDSGPKTSFGGDTRRKADRRLMSFKGAYGYKDISVEFSHSGRGTTGGTCFGDSGGPTFDISTPALDEQNLIVAVTSFGLNYNCNASGSYRLDQPDDIAFLADPAGAATDARHASKTQSPSIQVDRTRAAPISDGVANGSRSRTTRSATAPTSMRPASSRWFTHADPLV